MVLWVTDGDFCDALKRYGDRISNMILHTDLEWVDVAIQINEMRDFCYSHAPDKMELFEMVYASRFQRLWDSWRVGVSEDFGREEDC